MSIVKVVGEIATFRLSCADEPALCAAFAVPPSTKPTFGVLAGDAHNTLLPYRGEWNSDALSEWLAETARAVKDQIAMAYADDVPRDAFAGRAAAASLRLVTAAPEGAVPGGVAAERSRPLVLPPAIPAAAGGRADRAADGRGGARRAELPNGEMQPTYERVARPRALAELAAFNAYLHASGSAWDAGSGRGRGARRAAGDGARVDGLDGALPAHAEGGRHGGQELPPSQLVVRQHARARVAPHRVSGPRGRLRNASPRDHPLPRSDRAHRLRVHLRGWRPAAGRTRGMRAAPPRASRYQQSGVATFPSLPRRRPRRRRRGAA